MHVELLDLVINRSNRFFGHGAKSLELLVKCAQASTCCISVFQAQDVGKLCNESLLSIEVDLVGGIVHLVGFGLRGVEDVSSCFELGPEAIFNTARSAGSCLPFFEKPTIRRNSCTALARERFGLGNQVAFNGLRFLRFPIKFLEIGPAGLFKSTASTTEPSPQGISSLFGNARASLLVVLPRLKELCHRGRGALPPDRLKLRSGQGFHVRNNFFSVGDRFGHLCLRLRVLFLGEFGQFLLECGEPFPKPRDIAHGGGFDEFGGQLGNLGRNILGSGFCFEPLFGEAHTGFEVSKVALEIREGLFWCAIGEAAY